MAEATFFAPLLHATHCSESFAKIPIILITTQWDRWPYFTEEPEVQRGKITRPKLFGTRVKSCLLTVEIIQALRVRGSSWVSPHVVIPNPEFFPITQAFSSALKTDHWPDPPRSLQVTEFFKLYLMLSGCFLFFFFFFFPNRFFKPT